MQRLVIQEMMPGCHQLIKSGNVEHKLNTKLLQARCQHYTISLSAKKFARTGWGKPSYPLYSSHLCITLTHIKKRKNWRNEDNSTDENSKDASSVPKDKISESVPRSSIADVKVDGPAQDLLRHSAKKGIRIEDEENKGETKAAVLIQHEPSSSTRRHRFASHWPRLDS